MKFPEMNLRIDLNCKLCKRNKITTRYVPEKVENLCVGCDECRENVTVFLSLVRMYGRGFVSGSGVSVRVDKL